MSCNFNFCIITRQNDARGCGNKRNERFCTQNKKKTICDNHLWNVIYGIEVVAMLCLYLLVRINNDIVPRDFYVVSFRWIYKFLINREHGVKCGGAYGRQHNVGRCVRCSKYKGLPLKKRIQFACRGEGNVEEREGSSGKGRTRERWRERETLASRNTVFNFLVEID